MLGKHSQWLIDNLHYLLNIFEMLLEVTLGAYAQRTGFGHLTPDFWDRNFQSTQHSLCQQLNLKVLVALPTSFVLYKEDWLTPTVFQFSGLRLSCARDIPIWSLKCPFRQPTADEISRQDGTRESIGMHSRHVAQQRKKKITEEEKKKRYFLNFSNFTHYHTVQ